MNYKDYLVIISLPAAVNNQVSKFKKSCAKHVGIFESMHTKGHISFGLFGEEIESPRQSKFKLERFFELVAADIYNIEPIEININGFHFFDNGKNYKTIYAVVDLHPKTIAWFNLIKDKLKIKGQITPHITIAKRVSIDAFNKLWPFFEAANFSGSFVPDELTILTREGGSAYKVFKKLPFAKKSEVA